MDDYGPTIAKASAGLGGRTVALSEYGAGANVAQHEEGGLHQPKPGGPFHPEEWQSFVHENAWATLHNNPKLWGTFVWVMFDFASDARDEGGTPGINDKGLVTHDRRTKKDAYFFYQANWSDQPMVHIAARRMTPRQQAETAVKVYPNSTEVELRVNGRSLGTTKPDAVHVFHWGKIVLQPGNNRIEAIAHAGGETLTDACEWVLGNSP